VEKDTLLVIHNHLESYRLTSADKDDYKSIIKNYKHPEANDSETKYQGLTEKISTHDSIRGLQVDSVMAYLEANQGKHILLCGDLNATPVSYIHHRLTFFSVNGAADKLVLSLLFRNRIRNHIYFLIGHQISPPARLIASVSARFASVLQR
jgi:hypothetical protein